VLDEVLSDFLLGRFVVCEDVPGVLARRNWTGYPPWRSRSKCDSVPRRRLGRALRGGVTMRTLKIVRMALGTGAHNARRRWQRRSSRLLVALLVSTAIGASTFVVTASAQGSFAVTCVASSATQCVATISLVPNMDVDVNVTLPANNGFSLNTFGGTPNSAPTFTSLNNGYWTGRP
jgi:hypothetical protein